MSSASEFRLHRVARLTESARPVPFTGSFLDAQWLRYMIGPQSWVDVARFTDLFTKADVDELWKLQVGIPYNTRQMYDTIDTITPRKTVWFSNERSRYGERELNEYPQPEVLKRVYALVKEVDPTVDSSLLNFYMKAEDSVAPHSDRTEHLLHESQIWTASLGHIRDFVLTAKYKDSKYVQIHRIPVTQGTVIIMGGKTQQTHKHAIPKSKIPTSMRVSFTFRSLKPNIQ